MPATQPPICCPATPSPGGDRRQTTASTSGVRRWSLGGHILLEAAKDLPRARGFAIYGTPPVGFPPEMADAFLPNPAMARDFLAR